MYVRLTYWRHFNAMFVLIYVLGGKFRLHDFPLDRFYGSGERYKKSSMYFSMMADDMSSPTIQWSMLTFFVTMAYVLRNESHILRSSFLWKKPKANTILTVEASANIRLLFRSFEQYKYLHYLRQHLKKVRGIGTYNIITNLSHVSVNSYFL